MSHRLRGFARVSHRAARSDAALPCSHRAASPADGAAEKREAFVEPRELEQARGDLRAKHTLRNIN